MEEDHAIALQFLQDKALATEKADPQAFLEGDAQAHTLGGTKEGILLANEGATDVGQIHRHDLARIRGREGHAALAAGHIGIDGDEQGFAGQQTLSRPHQTAHEPGL